MRRSLAILCATTAMFVSAAIGAHSRGGSRSRVLTTAPAVLFQGGDRPLRIGRPAPHTGGNRAEDCARCHVEIAREWQESQHKIAWTDDVFQAAYAIEPMAFCVNCHAPLTSPTGAGARHSPTGHALPSGLAATDGISCSVCHVRDGVILSSGNSRGDAVRQPGQPTPHGVLADPRFSQATFCAGCHQFNFPAEPSPGGPLYDSHAPMQDTFEEWQRSAFSQQNVHCQECHMPWRDGANGTRYRSHRFLGASDPALLSQAVRVSATATLASDGRTINVSAQVVPGRIGHAFPTGDLFRRAELRVWVDGDEAHAETLGFAREFSDRYQRIPNGPAGFVRVQVSDHRVQPPGTGLPDNYSFVFHTTASNRASINATHTIHWKLEHLLMPTPLAASQGFGPAVNRRTVTEGSVQVQSNTPPPAQRMHRP